MTDIDLLSTADKLCEDLARALLRAQRVRELARLDGGWLTAGKKAQLRYVSTELSRTVAKAQLAADIVQRAVNRT